MMSIRRTGVGAGLLLSVVMASVGQVSAAPVKWDIKAQPMADALNQWAQTTGLQVIFPEEAATAALVAPAVHGRYVPQVALAKLLENSGLKYEYLNERTVAVRPAQAQALGLGSDDAAPPASAPPAQSDSPTQESSSSEASAAEGGSDEQKTTGREELTEIVVTAQKRVERLQDVPVPVTAVSAESLVNSNQLRLEDYYTRIPGLNLTPGSLYGGSRLLVRGLNSGGGQATVGVTIDDIPYTASAGAGLAGLVAEIDPSELARVEVLRGPQGTLYGASSLGGLLKYVTVDPSTDRIFGVVQGGLNSISHGDDLGHSVRASVNLPLGETSAIRVSGFTRRDAGYIDDPVHGLDDVNRMTVSGGRLSALWRPSEDFSVKLGAIFQDTDLQGAAFTNPLPGAGELVQSMVPGSGGYRKKLQVYSANVNAKLGNVEVTSISAYTDNDTTFLFDLTPLFGTATDFFIPGATGTPAIQGANTAKFTQEIRFAAPLGERVQGLFGVFYNHENNPEREILLGSDFNTGQPIAEFAHLSFPSTIEEYAAFTNLTFSLTDRFDVQVGGRYSENEQTALMQQGGLLFGSPVPDTLLYDVRSKDSSFTYLVTPRFRFSPELMMYARLASGYRPGGPNTTAALGAPPEFGPDQTQNYEIGFKGSLLDSLLSFDASLYYIEWKDIQVSLQAEIAGGGVVGYTGNAGRARSRGAELSVESRPVRGLVISGSITLNDSELSEDFPPGGTVGFAGDRLPLGSRFLGNVSFDQSFPLQQGITGFIGGSVSYVGDRAGEFRTAGPQRLFPGYSYFNLSAGVRYESWSVNAFANNLTDKRVIVVDDPDYNAFIYNPPRTIGVSLSREF